MPYLLHHDAHFALAFGETRVGPGANADVRIPEGVQPGDEEGATLVVIAIGNDGAASLRAEQGDAGVFVNGLPVGREPAPLLHGDRVAIDGCELRFADEERSGDTGEHPVPGDGRIATPSAGVDQARSRGRIVSLTDGREYAVPATGLSIGRDAACDVVVVAADVSRRHARIALTGHGYEVLDSSANGVLLNGLRVQGHVSLAKGDMLRIGTDEFRFYADVEAPAPPQSLQQVPSLQATSAIPAMKRPFPPPDAPLAHAAESGMSTASGPRHAPGPSGRRDRAPLATLEILNEGASKGTRFELVAPLSHIGRGDHNDVVVLDESVSESHAKIQRREDAWYIVDMDSTNGTYVAGSRILGESRVSSGMDLRFGGVKMAFRILGGGQRGTGETRVIVGVRGPDPKRAEQRLKELARGVDAREAPAERSGAPAWIWLALAALVAFFIYLVLQGS